MEKIEETKVLTTTIYKTADGEKFSTQEAAERHEAKVKAITHGKEKFRVTGTKEHIEALFGGNISTQWAYLASEDDRAEFNAFFFDILERHQVEIGWNLITTEYNNNGPDYINSYSLSELKERLKNASDELEEMENQVV